MKRIYNITGEQTREFAELLTNKTGFSQPSRLAFVQIDDLHAVDNTGAIFQIIDKESALEIANTSAVLQYEGPSGNIYNYAEDTPDFEEDSDDIEIYSHCTEIAGLLYEE